MPHQFNLTPTEISTLLAFASDDDARVNLYGIAFEADGMSERVYATNGHRALVRIQHASETVDRFIVSTAIMRSMATMGGVTVERNEKHADIRCQELHARLPLAYQPPPIAGILEPTESWAKSTPWIGLNVALLDDLVSLAGLGRGWALTMPPSRADPIRLDLDDVGAYWIAIVMPMRMLEIPELLPEHHRAQAIAERMERDG